MIDFNSNKANFGSGGAFYSDTNSQNTKIL